MYTSQQLLLLREAHSFDEFCVIWGELGIPGTANSAVYLSIMGANSMRIIGSKIDKKKRHMTQDERKALHRPASDWIDSKKGDKCISATTVEVVDIVTKHLGSKAGYKIKTTA